MSIATQTVGAETYPSPAPQAPPPPEPKPEVVTYSKAVQTDVLDRQVGTSDDSDASGAEDGTGVSPEGEEEIRQRIRKEVEEELQIAEQDQKDAANANEQLRYPLRTLDDDELKAVTSSDDFLDFVERSAKVIERALDEEYDVLADYEFGGIDGELEEDEETGKKRRGIREVCQFYDERESKKRQVTDISFSPKVGDLLLYDSGISSMLICSKFPELVLASYTKASSANEPDGIVQVWNQHLHSRPEYTFESTANILTAKFSPFHPNLVVGGSYSGQVLLWDTRSRSRHPVQKTPLSGAGHAHPVYSISIIGTQNAHNIITVSTDGVVCGWTVDMLSQPQEYLELTTPPPSKTEDLAPTTISFPQSDPTFFVVGTEEGGIYPCHRYDRAGSKAGTDQRVAYRGHTAPIMSTAFHPARGPVDLGELMLSSSLDWSVKLWRVRPPVSSATINTGLSSAQVISPTLDITREDVVYDARWSPHRPGVFSLVDGAGNLEVWDLCADTEVPVVRTTPSRSPGDLSYRSLNKVAWEEREGRRLATGGLNGVVTVFEVGKGLGGPPDEVPADEWTGMKRLLGKLDQKDRVA